MKNLIFLLTLLGTTTFFSAFSDLYPEKIAATLVEGIVMEEGSKSPLIGASVLIKGTAIGTTTDYNGAFSLSSDHPLPWKLEVSYTGYATQVVTIETAQNNFKITLTQAESLDEVVVMSKRTKPTLFKSENYTISSAAKPSCFSVSTGDPIPQHFNREGYDYIQENKFHAVNNEPISTFSIDVDAASYSNMRRFINMGLLPPKDGIRVEELINYFDYDYPNPSNEDPFSIITEISTCPWNSENKLLHIGLQGQKMENEDLPPSNLVFLIDVSGSMSSPNKLQLLKSSFKLLVDQLRPEDKVAIVVYAGSSGVVLPSTTGTNKQLMIDALERLVAGGSTAGGEGIQLAYKIARENFIKGANNRVILATDGDFNVGQSSDSELVRLIEKERESGVFLSILGFGMGNYQDSKMQKLANAGNGNHAYIDNIKEAKKVFINEFGGTLFTIAKDVKIQIEFNPTKVAGYRLIGYENRILDKEDFNDDKKDAGELGAGHTVTALYEIIPKGVKSDYLSEVDEMKYQVTKSTSTAAISNEMLTIKFRYKKPDGKKSQLIERPILDQDKEISNTSDNFRFSAAVAGFGMLLRESDYKKNASYAQCIELAKAAKGLDANGYRKEFIDMMEIVKVIDTNSVAKK